MERARATARTAVLQRDTAENRLFSSTTFYAAGMAVFFLFFTVEFGVRSLLAERENGTLARLLVAPMRPGWIIGGKAVASFVVGLTSMVVPVVASTFLLGAKWGDPLGVAVLIVCGSWRRWGSWPWSRAWPRHRRRPAGTRRPPPWCSGCSAAPSSQSRRGRRSCRCSASSAPQAWLMRGFQELAGGAGIGDVLPSFAALLAIAAVLGGIATARSDRLVPR